MVHHITYDPPLPLTMYRELAAHLEQLPGVITELLSQEADRFDYSLSQTGGIRVEIPEVMGPREREIYAQILQYYGNYNKITL